MTSRGGPRRNNPMHSALRAWTLGPLPECSPSERWSLPDEITAPDDGPRARRTGAYGSWALLAVLLAVLGVAVARSDPFSRGWRDPAPALSRVLEPRLERVVATLAAALGPAAQSPRGSSSGR